jgi:hypothetical protein
MPPRQSKCLQDHDKGLPEHTKRPTKQCKSMSSHGHQLQDVLKGYKDMFSRSSRPINMYPKYDRCIQVHAKRLPGLTNRGLLNMIRHGNKVLDMSIGPKAF